jgi:outer membrane immunogenic protein
MTRLLSCAGAVTLAFATQASFAADMRAPVAKAPAAVVAAPFSWTGSYLGLHLGADSGRATSSSADSGFDGEPDTHTARDNSVFGGVQAGYNWQSGNYVAGVEAEIGHFGAKGSVIEATDHYVDFRYGWYGTLTARFGYAWDRSLLYLKAGGAIANIRNTAADIDNGEFDPSAFTRIEGTRGGWSAGAGWEQAFAPNWSMKLEYLYLDLGKRTSSDISGATYTHRNHVHSVKFGLNYRFATDKYPVAPGVTKN